MARQIDELYTVLGWRRGDEKALKQYENRVEKMRRNINAVANRMLAVGAAGAAAMGLIGRAGIQTDEALRRTGAALNLTEKQMVANPRGGPARRLQTAAEYRGHHQRGASLRKTGRDI